MKVKRLLILVLSILCGLLVAMSGTAFANTDSPNNNTYQTETDTANCNSADGGENLVYDDGLYEHASGSTSIVSLFTPTNYPFHLTHGCICWVSEVSPADLDFEVVIYADTDNGPGELLASFPSRAENLSRWLTTSSIYQVPVNYVLSSGSVYIGATKTSQAEAFLCADQSGATQQQTIYHSQDQDTSQEWETMERPYRAMSIRVSGEYPHSTFSITDNWVNSTPADMSLPVAIYPGSIEVYAVDPTTNNGTLAVRVNNQQIEAAGIPSPVEGFTLLAKGVHPLMDQPIEVYRLATGEFQLNTWQWDGSPYQVIWTQTESITTEN